MSNHNAKRSKIAVARATYTQEPRYLAARGVFRQTAGLDWCTPEQRRFRALLAFFLLNTQNVPDELLLDQKGYCSVAVSGVSRLMWNSIKLSPQPNDVTILTGQPDHLVQCVATTRIGIVHGIPGLRAVEVEGEGEALVLRHMPTGANLRIRFHDVFDSRRRKPLWFYPTHWNRLVRSSLVDANEQALLAATPSMSDDSVCLLAGLVARLSCWSEQENWSVGFLFEDDIQGRNWGGSRSGSFVHLWGGGNEWVLRWGGGNAVPPTDVARALTHEFIGMEGVTQVEDGSNRAEIRLGRARLKLEFHKVSLFAGLVGSPNRGDQNHAREEFGSGDA